MSITINPPIIITAHKKGAEGSSPVLDFLPARAENILYGGKTVKEALDELFGAFASPLPERGWQKFTETGEFAVPEGVTRVLVMCIGAGSSTASTRGGGTFVSRYLPVTPGESIPVKVGTPQPKGTTLYNNPTLEQQSVCSSFNGTVLQALWRGRYAVDGTIYTFSNSSPVFPSELADKGMNTAAAIPGSVTANTSKQGTAGTGGYAVAADVPDERAAWLEVARDLPPGKAPSGRVCYPDTTQLAENYSGMRAGAGANYGGSAGCWPSSQGYTTYAAAGGAGLVCVFWGDDIEKAPQETPAPAPTTHRKEGAASLTPLNLLSDSRLLPYVNTEVGLTEGSSVADALDALYARLAEKKENS